MERILYKAETTGSLFDFIQTNDDSLDISTLREQLVHLLLCGVEGQIAYVQRTALFQQLLLIIAVSLNTIKHCITLISEHMRSKLEINT